MPLIQWLINLESQPQPSPQPRGNVTATYGTGGGGGGYWDWTEAEKIAEEEQYWAERGWGRKDFEEIEDKKIPIRKIKKKEKFSIFGEIRKAVPITTLVPLEALSGYDEVKSIIRKRTLSNTLALGVGLLNKKARKLLLTGVGLVGAEKLVQAQDEDEDD